MNPMKNTPLKEARKRRGLSVYEVAEAVGTSTSNLSRMENGLSVPRAELARRLYQFYAGDIEPIDLYDPTFMDEVGVVEPSGQGWYRVRTRTGEHRVQGINALAEFFDRMAAEATP